jgi:putative ABC transport system ATP-binding protein
VTTSSQRTGTVLSVDAVTVSRGSVPVLETLSFAVTSGAVVAVQGKSGSGKSTLLATLCGLLAPTTGVTYVLGERFDTLSDRARSAVRLNSFGLVFQDGELIPELTIGENVTLPLRLGPRAKRTAEYRSLLDPLLSRLGIADLADRLPSQVSGGQLQRAAIARAVIHRPAIILADEPTEALDGDSARAALQILIDLARDTRAAVVVVTHDDAIAARCDTSMLLADGRLAEAPLRAGTGGG